MRLPIVQVDAFSEHLFAGNPAAVVRLGDQTLADEVLQGIAAENNLSETAFVSSHPRSGHFGLRWFTPTLEVDLCGHATLAAGAVVLDEDDLQSVVFHTRSGPLTVSRDPAGFAMDLPRIPWQPMPPEAAVVEVLGAVPVELHAVRETHGARYVLAVFSQASDVHALRPDTVRMGAELGMNFIATAPSGQAGLDFVSRFFAPASGVPEDPVTGSAHCTLAPFWAQRLNRTALVARQVSARGGTLHCRVGPERVTLIGACSRYLEGHIRIPSP